MKSKICAIVAMDENRVIGHEGKLPWHIPEDMKYFRDTTSGHPVIMGRKTFDSLPERFKPLPGRLNVVLTRNPSALADYPEVIVYDGINKFEEALTAGRFAMYPSLWIIGGSEIYAQTQHLWDEVYLTLVQGEHKGDAYLPSFEEDFEEVSRKQFEQGAFLKFVRR